MTIENIREKFSAEFTRELELFLANSNLDKKQRNTLFSIILKSEEHIL